MSAPHHPCAALRPPRFEPADLGQVNPQSCDAVGHARSAVSGSVLIGPRVVSVLEVCDEFGVGERQSQARDCGPRRLAMSMHDWHGPSRSRVSVPVSRQGHTFDSVSVPLWRQPPK